MPRSKFKTDHIPQKRPRLAESAASEFNKQVADIIDAGNACVVVRASPEVMEHNFDNWKDVMNLIQTHMGDHVVGRIGPVNDRAALMHQYMSKMTELQTAAESSKEQLLAEAELIRAEALQARNSVGSTISTHNTPGVRNSTILFMGDLLAVKDESQHGSLKRIELNTRTGFELFFRGCAFMPPTRLIHDGLDRVEMLNFVSEVSSDGYLFFKRNNTSSRQGVKPVKKGCLGNSSSEEWWNKNCSDKGTDPDGVWDALRKNYDVVQIGIKNEHTFNQGNAYTVRVFCAWDAIQKRLYYHTCFFVNCSESPEMTLSAENTRVDMQRYVNTDEPGGSSDSQPLPAWIPTAVHSMTRQMQDHMFRSLEQANYLLEEVPAATSVFLVIALDVVFEDGSFDPYVIEVNSANLDGVPEVYPIFDVIRIVGGQHMPCSHQGRYVSAFTDLQFSDLEASLPQ